MPPARTNAINQYMPRDQQRVLRRDHSVAHPEAGHCQRARATGQRLGGNVDVGLCEDLVGHSARS
jgi:hypothetical protein